MKKNLNYYRNVLLESNIDIKSNYEGINTFLGVQYKNKIEDIDVALIGVAFDIATSGYPGARLGPQAIRNIGNAPGVYSRGNGGVFPYERLAVADIGDLRLDNKFSIKKAHQDIYTYYLNLIKQNVIPITVGGDHSITLPILRALAKDRPVSLVHFDAHCDTEEGYGGSEYPHGSTFLHAARENLILPEYSVQIGIRDGWDMFWNENLKSKMKILNMDFINDNNIKTVSSVIKKTVADNPVYVSFDIDCLDPAFAPGTGSPEMGGITSYQARRMVQELNGLNIIGADVVEISPQLDHSNITALVGASILLELLCIIANSREV